MLEWKYMSKLIKLSAIAGILSPFVLFATVLFSAAVSPWFSFNEFIIGVLGFEGAYTRLFNLGLLVAGVLYLFLVIGLSATLRTGWRWPFLTAGCLSAFGLAGMGLFPYIPYLVAYNIASTAFFTFAGISIGLYGMENIQRKSGKLSLLAGIILLTILFISAAMDNNGFVQMLMIVPWAAWSVFTGVSLLMQRDYKQLG